MTTPATLQGAFDNTSFGFYSDPVRKAGDIPILQVHRLHSLDLPIHMAGK